MAKRLSNKTRIDSADKKRRLENRYSDFLHPEITINHAYLDFRIRQKEKRNSEETIAFYDRCFKKLKAVTENGEAPVEVMTMPSFQLAFIESLGDVSQQTINSYLRGYRAFGRYWENVGWLDGFEAPIKEVPPPIKEVYTDEELDKLTRKPDINDFVQFRDYCIIILLLATGCRSKTLINLKIKDVNLEESKINFNTLKNHSVIQLSLLPKAKRDLEEYIMRWRDNADKEAYLFCNDFGYQLSRNGLDTTIRKYNNARGVEKTSIHLFRHTFAKNWITSGGDIITLAKVLTHSELEMVKRYANLYATDISNEMEEHSTLSQMKTKSGKTFKTSKR